MIFPQLPMKHILFFSTKRIFLLLFLLTLSTQLDAQCHSFDTDIRNIRQNAFPNFYSNYGDYVQYAPLVLVPSLKAFGVPTRNNWGRLLSGAAFSAVISTGVSRGLKPLINRTRPNGIHHSFPSGHTTTAFTAAHVLHKEYGWYNKWISIAGYTAAMVTATQRVATDWHWMSDTFAGAVLGIASVELGYFLNDLIWKEKGRCHKFDPYAHSHYDPASHNYYTIEWLYGMRLILGPKGELDDSSRPYRGGIAALQAEMPWTRGALGSTLPGAEGTIPMSSGIKVRLGAQSLTYKNSDSFNIYSALVGSYWAMAITEWFEAEAHLLVGANWNSGGAGVDLNLGLSANFITGDAFKVKAFAEFETFKYRRTEPFLASFILGYSAGFYF